MAFTIFRYAREQRIIVISPFEGLKRPTIRRAIPGILQPPEFKRLLKTAESEFVTLLPFLCFQGFAGIRRQELLKKYAGDQVLQWRDVDWDKRIITIRDEVAKRTTRSVGDRRFIPMEEALLRWLEPYSQAGGPVVPMTDKTFRDRFRPLPQAAKVIIPRNGLCHSFGSYWLARSQNAGLGRLALIMGNSEEVCKRHYVETLTPAEGEEWFEMSRLEPDPSDRYFDEMDFSTR